MTRGNRQGNNAFLEFEDNFNNAIQGFNDEGYQEAMKERQLTPELMKGLDKILGGTNSANATEFFLTQSISEWLQFTIRVGDYKLAQYVVGALYKQTNYGFNDLHYNVLRDYKNGEKLPEFKSVSTSKKANMNLNITPLHFACINPNSDVLAQILAVNGDINMLDQEMRRPLHYAAACSSSANLELLLEKGANLTDIDNKKTTCLHTAVMARRADNVRLIVQKNEGLITMRDRSGMTAMAYACKNSDLESIKALLETGKVKVNAGLGKDRMQPLGWAAMTGNYELCEWLILNKARVIGCDKFKRTPLIMAIRNGHIKVASLLLKYGADWMQADSSGNTPLHYAAAYGWMECMDLLLKTGADINAENSWRVTPINIAMLKNHEGCVKKLLEHPEVDVNCKDEKGRTLLTLSLMDLTERTVNFVKYLLEKGADPNIADID